MKNTIFKWSKVGFFQLLIDLMTIFIFMMKHFSPNPKKDLWKRKPPQHNANIIERTRNPEYLKLQKNTETPLQNMTVGKFMCSCFGLLSEESVRRMSEVFSYVSYTRSWCRTMELYSKFSPRFYCLQKIHKCAAKTNWYLWRTNYAIHFEPSDSDWYCVEFHHRAKVHYKLFQILSFFLKTVNISCRIFCFVKYQESGK